MTRTTLSCGIAAWTLVFPIIALGQFEPGGRGPGGGGGDPFGLADIKTQIKATNEEWKVIGPMIRTAMAAQQAVNAELDPNSPTPSGGGDPMAGRGGRGGGGMGNDSFGGPGQTSGGDRGGRGGRGGFGPQDGGPRGFGGGPTSGPNGGPPEGGDFQRGGRGPGGPGGQGGPGGFGGGGGGRGGGPMGGRNGGNAVLTALTTLKTTLDDPAATKEDIAAKVTAVRVARTKARADLEAAQKNLLLLLTPDQQAILAPLDILN